MTMLEWAGAVLMVLGGLMALSAGISMLVLPDVAARIQAATKPQVLGLLLVVLGAAPFLDWYSAATMLALVALFQLVSAPVLAQLVARSSYRAGTWRHDLLVVDELADAGGEPGADRSGIPADEPGTPDK